MYNKLNRYDYALIVIIASLAYGHYELLRAFVPLRIIGAFTLPLILKNIKFIYSSPFKYWAVLMVFWWYYMVLSFFWTPVVSKAIISFFHITTMMSCFLFFCFCSMKARNPITSINIGWILLCLITLPIAFWEIYTGNHLSSGSFNEGNMLGGGLRTFAAVTFRNLNSYVVVLCCALPFALSSFLYYKGKVFLKMLLSLVVLSIVYVLLINASRAGIVCLIICLFFFFSFLYKKNKAVGLFVFSIFFFTIVFFVIKNLDDISLLTQILTRLQNRNVFEDETRMSLWITGYEISENMFFFGGGVASMVPLYEKTNSYICFAHNFFIEFLVEYGLMISFVFFFVFYKSLVEMMRIEYTHLRYMAYYAFFSSFFLFIIDDGYLSRYVSWVYIASLISFCYIGENRKSVI